MQSISILGSTGSVGKSTLDVVSRHPGQFKVAALTANSNTQVMLEQCQVFSPELVVMVSEKAAEELVDGLKAVGLSHIQVTQGPEALISAATLSSCDAVMSAIVGAAGLVPTLAAVKAGKRTLIANKEPLVMTGDMFMREAELSGAVVLPIDSEHNAIFQCMPQDQSKHGVSRLHLTASGGPFLGREWSDLADITPEQACAHPNWSMGRKISVDSATMMNKGLELIEATALFGLPAERVEIVVHPQSIIHSMVEYTDGSFLAQLGAPDMRIPIAHALSWPERIESGAATLDITEIARLDFQKPDMQNMPCLALARQAAQQGSSLPIALNAANEVAVEAFLESAIRFTSIPLVIESAMTELESELVTNLDSVLNIDNEARRIAKRTLDLLG